MSVHVGKGLQTYCLTRDQGGNPLTLKVALVIVQPNQCGVRRLVAAFGTMRRRVAALHKLIHRAER